MIEVNRREFVNYCEFFICFKNVIAVEAILLGKSKGRLFIDDLSEPNALVIWNEFDGFYISLKSNAYLSFAKDVVSKMTKLISSELNEFVIYIDEKYDNEIQNIIPAESLEKLEVLFFSAQAKTSDVKYNGQYRVEEIRNLGSLDGLDGSDDLIEVINSTWCSYEDFLRTGEGVVLIDTKVDSVLGYCIAEHVTDDSLEFSIEIAEEHQKKGLGTVLGHEMLDICHRENRRPCWYCTDDNQGSVKLAEKIGLEPQPDFHVWYFETKN